MFKTVPEILRSPSLRRTTAYVLLAVILIFGAGLRLFRLGDLTVFLADQGAYFERIRHMLESHRLLLVGGGSGVADFSRGPAFHFLLLGPYLLGGGNPVFAAIFIALLDAATLLIIFSIGRTLANSRAGLTAAALYACAYWAVNFARIIWTPSPIPFFAALMLYALIQISKGRDAFILLLIPVWCVAWQIYDPPLFFLPLFGVFWIWYRPRVSLRHFLPAAFLGGLALAPYLVYEATHAFIDLRTMVNFSLAPDSSGPSLWIRTGQRLSELPRLIWGMTSRTRGLRPLLLAAALMGAVSLAAALRKKPRSPSTVVLFYAMIVPLFIAFPAPLNIRYLTILFPLLPLLIGFGMEFLWKRARPLGALMMIVLAAAVAADSRTIFLSIRKAAPKPGSLDSVSKVVDHIIRESKGGPFNVKIVSIYRGAGFVEAPYRHLFAIRKRSPVDRADIETFVVYDPQDQDTEGRAPGTVINGIKVARLEAPAATGPNILVNGNLDFSGEREVPGWISRPGATGAVERDDHGGGILLSAARMSDPVESVQDFQIESQARYLVSFHYRNRLTAGAQCVYVTTYDPSGRMLNTWPDGAGYVARKSAEWTKGSFIVDADPRGTRATIWLRNRGVGESRFRDIQVRKLAPSRSP